MQSGYRVAEKSIYQSINNHVVRQILIFFLQIVTSDAFPTAKHESVCPDLTITILKKMGSKMGNKQNQEKIYIENSY